VRIDSERSGYVYLLMTGPDGKTFDLLFLNHLNRNHRIEAGKSPSLPRRRPFRRDRRQSGRGDAL
jgi:hypothetical protein